MFKKLMSLLLVSVFGVTLIACKTTETTGTTASSTTNSTTATTSTVPGDKIPPAFVGAVEGKLEGIEHLKGEEVNLLEGVQARDNVAGFTPVLSIINFGGYDKDVPGEYTIVIQAQDEAGNKTTVEKPVKVIDTLTRTLNAILIGDKFTEYVFNDTEALTYTSSGTKFRSFDTVQVMTKQFFIDEFNAHKAEHTNNGSVPYFPNGIIVILDNNMKPKLVRLAAGISVEVNANGELKTTELSWTNTVDKTNGGGNFKGLVEELDTVIPDGGYIMFSGNFGEQKGRIFLIQNYFYSSFETGAVTTEQFDADFTQVTAELKEGYTEVIAVPDKLPAPVISINKHVLGFDAIANAKEYEIYVDGELKTTITTTSLPIANLELALTPDGDAGYDIQVKAITKDMYMWSTSDLSATIVYKKIDILPLPTPVLTLNDQTITWDFAEGALSYDVYIKIAGTSTKISNVTEGTFNFSQYVDQYRGYNYIYVIGIGDDDHLNSASSELLEVLFGEIKSLKIGEYTVDVIETTALNYFSRRNNTYTDTEKSGFAKAPFLFLITDINSIKNTNFGVTATEAYSTIVLLDQTGKPKLINNIMPKQTWKIGQGWITDEIYASNGSQLVNMTDSIVEGDMLLIGKNENMLTVTKTDGSSLTSVNSRDFIAYHYVKTWDTFPTAPVAPNGWRAPITSFIDPTNVTFTINPKA